MLSLNGVTQSFHHGIERLRSVEGKPAWFRFEALGLTGNVCLREMGPLRKPHVQLRVSLRPGTR